MQKRLASLQKFILYGSIDREIYDEARKETDVTNLRTVKRISIQGMLLFFLNALFSLAMYGNNPGFVLNMFSAGTTGIIAFVALGIPETRAKSSLKLVYTFSTFFLFGLLLIDGLMYTRVPSVCFIGCMIIFVVVFNDVRWHLCV